MKANMAQHAEDHGIELLEGVDYKDLKAVVGFHTQAILDHFKKSGRYISPPEMITFATLPSGKIVPCIGGVPNDTEDRVGLFCKGLRRVLRDIGAINYVIMTEAWMSKGPLPDGARPSQDPNRIEVLSIIGGNEVQSYGEFLEIGRDADGKVVSLTKHEYEADHFGGRLAKLMSVGPQPGDDEVGYTRETLN